MSHALQSDLYGNQVVTNPQGEPMFRCGHDRANWYLNRGLAERIDEFTLRLTFAPKGNGYRDDPFYMQGRKNECVVCGRKDQLSRHHVVPHCYRTHMSDDIKSASYHDVLALCIDCHQVYENRHSAELRQNLSEQYNAPVEGTGLLVDNLSLWARGAAKALVFYAEKIPPDRIEELRGRVRCFFGRNLSNDEMVEFIDMMNGFKNVRRGPHYKSHGQIVMEQVEDVQGFVEMWRQNFLDTMQPKHMPVGWDVKRDVFRKNDRHPMPDEGSWTNQTSTNS